MAQKHNTELRRVLHCHEIPWSCCAPALALPSSCSPSLGKDTWLFCLLAPRISADAFSGQNTNWNQNCCLVLRAQEPVGGLLSLSQLWMGSISTSLCGCCTDNKKLRIMPRRVSKNKKPGYDFCNNSMLRISPSSMLSRKTKLLIFEWCQIC